MPFAGRTSASPATGQPMFGRFLTSSRAASRGWSSTATCSKRRLGETAYSSSGSALLPRDDGEGASRERPEPRPLQARAARVAAGVEKKLLECDADAPLDLPIVGGDCEPHWP